LIYQRIEHKVSGGKFQFNESLKRLKT